MCRTCQGLITVFTGDPPLLVSEILDGLGIVEGTGAATMTFERARSASSAQ